MGNGTADDNEKGSARQTGRRAGGWTGIRAGTELTTATTGFQYPRPFPARTPSPTWSTNPTTNESDRMRYLRKHYSTSDSMIAARFDRQKKITFSPPFIS